MNVSFTIENKSFNCALDAGLSEFQVKSSPKPYGVQWEENPNPMSSVDRILQENSKNLLLIDKNVFELYGKILNINKERIFIAESTESFKTLDGVTQVLDFLNQHSFTKGEKLVVVGGGIVEDVGAFVGACFKRGIQWHYFPTTLLSMCDSCIGGKTGINYKNAKNQIALFSAPTKVIINPNFLKTLPPDAIQSGMGEALKLFITGGLPFLDLYQEHIINGHVKSFSAYKPLIMNSLNIKRAIVEDDEFEFNHRRSLNYGHTLGHAVESISNYEIPHGSAVVVGMLLINELSLNRGLLSAEKTALLNRLCFQLLDPKVLSIMQKLNVKDILSLLQKDKKTEGSMVTFVMMKAPGDTHFVKVPLDSSLFVEIEDTVKSLFGSN